MNTFLLLSQRLAFGRRLAEARLGRHISAAECARAAGVSSTAFSLWRKDENAISPKAARPLGDFLGVDPYWLETGEGYPERAKNADAAVQSEKALALQLERLIKLFFEASPLGRDQLLDFAAEAIEKAHR